MIRSVNVIIIIIIIIISSYLIISNLIYHLKISTTYHKLLFIFSLGIHVNCIMNFMNKNLPFIISSFVKKCTFCTKQSEQYNAAGVKMLEDAHINIRIEKLWNRLTERHRNRETERE